jgi:UDP-GlcNAc:undecaprenyl-phosphate GlcNAc-1-phosphate transferase
MALGFCIPILLWLPPDRFVVSVMIGSAILVAAGLADDMYVLGYKSKFLAQIAAALVVILYGGVRITTLGTLLPEGFVLPPALSFPFTLLVMLGVTNAVNLADGLDGLAGGIAMMTFLCICALAFRSGETAIAIMSLAMLGALFGFLSFNTYPASVFMGDAGSQFLGFVSIVLPLKMSQAYSPLSPVLPLLIVGLPVIDTLIVMSERIRSGRSPFVADHNHFHHKLLGIGLFHTEAVFIIYLLQSIFVLSAYVFRFYSDWFILALYLVLSGAIIVFSHAACVYDLRIRRFDLIDRVIKGRLKILKDKNRVLHVSAVVLYYLLPALLIANCLLAKDIPDYATVLSLILVPFIICCWALNNRMLGNAVRTILYFMIPAAIYFSQDQPMSFSGLDFSLVYLGSCIVCLVTALITVRLNRRENSFRSSPMDFLILVIALCVSPLLNSIMDPQKARMFLIQILIFFYCYEILLNEKRKGRNIATATTVGALLIIALKGALL